LNAKLSTNEKENEALVYRLTSMELTMQELDERFRAKEVEFDTMQELNEELSSDNEQLKKINEELIRQFESKQATPEVSNKNVAANIESFAEQMTKELAAKFSIDDQNALKSFASSYLSKFQATASKENGINQPLEEELKTNQVLNEELVNEREKNVKLQSDYQKLKEDFEKIGKKSSPSKDYKEKEAGEDLTKKLSNVDQMSNMYQQITSQRVVKFYLLLCIITL